MWSCLTQQVLTRPRVTPRPSLTPPDVWGEQKKFGWAPDIMSPSLLRLSRDRAPDFCEKFSLRNFVLCGEDERAREKKQVSGISQDWYNTRFVPWPCLKACCCFMLEVWWWGCDGWDVQQSGDVEAWHGFLFFMDVEIAFEAVACAAVELCWVLHVLHYANSCFSWGIHGFSAFFQLSAIVIILHPSIHYL